MREVLLALGSNQPGMAGGARRNLAAAIVALADAGLEPVQKSPLYQTPAYPPGSGPDFANAAVSVAPPPGLAPRALLSRLHAVEAAFGRERGQRWAPRTLDIDLIAMGDLVCPDRDTQAAWMALAPGDQDRAAPRELILPHPRLQDRAFVLVPLSDIAPQWRHPVSGLSVGEMLARLPLADRDAIAPVAWPQ